MIAKFRIYDKLRVTFEYWVEFCTEMQMKI